MSRLTILICTHNREALLEKVLTSLNAALRPEQWDVDILIAANACTDGTHAFLENYQQQASNQGWLPLTWFAEPTPGKSFAINASIPRIETSDLVAFVDDDHRVDENYLASICKAADDYPKATLFCGRILPDWDGSEPAWVHDDGPYKIYPLPIPRQELGPTPRLVTIDTGPLPGGGNLILRTTVFKRVAGFSTELGPKGHDLGGGEDSAFIANTLNKGETLQYIPEILQFHYVDTERLQFFYLLRKAYQRSRSAWMVHQKSGSVPLFMWRKLAEHSLRVMLPFSWPRTRFYLMRVASTLGEIRGARDSMRINRQHHRKNSQQLPLAPDKEKFTTKIIGAATVGSGLLALLAGHSLILQGILPALIVALLGTGILLLKSMQDFSQTGPRIQKEVLLRYKWYSIFALSRLSLWAFGLMLLIAGAGAILYAALALIYGHAYSPWLAAAFAALAIVTATAMQFCYKLLWNPGLLIASMHYRASRFYSLWDKLNPSRLRKLFLLAIGIISAILLTASLELITLKQPSLLIALWSASFFYIGLFFWSRHTPSTTSQTNQPKAGQPNIIMIGSDTLRADSLGKGLTPNIDKLSSRGSRFTQCYVPCARTAPSLVSMMTGTWPQTHGIRDNFVADDETNLSISALPEWLSKQGYVSAAISDWCGADIGKFDFGFDYLDLPEDQWNLKYFIRQGPKDLRLFLSLFTHNRLGRKFLPEIYYLGGVPLTSQLGKRARHLVSQLAQTQQPFFFNAFYSTTHPPFASEYPWYAQHSCPGYKGESKFAMARLTEPFDIIRRQGEPKEEFDLDQILSLYDGCVAQFDHEVGCMLEQLESSGLADNTIVVIYSDHGMEFFEHDTWGQGNSAIGEASPRIPLIIYDPRRNSTAQIEQIVRSIDIAPTLAELAGAAIPTEVDGVSLVPVLDDPDQKLDLCAFSETGLWLTDIPGLPKDHLRYPDLLELITVPDLTTGTLAIKDEYIPRILAAKDMMVRKGKWKLVYQPLETSCLLLLFDMDTDPQCKHDCAPVHPEIVQSLHKELDTWAQHKVKATSA